MTVYIDSNFKCHCSASPGRRAFEVGFFDGKCPAFVAGYRYVPAGESWQRADGRVFVGEMLAPWQDHRRLELAQQVYEEYSGKLEALREVLDGLSSNPGLEQLLDCISALRELFED